MTVYTEIHLEQFSMKKLLLVAPENSNNNYYKNYFKNKSLETEYMVAGDEVFTDIDSYEGNNYDEGDDVNNNYQGYAGWGQE